jgi:hypothetical protein
MSHDLTLVLWALLALQVKHFLCDFVLQTEYQVRTKGMSAASSTPDCTWS